MTVPDKRWFWRILGRFQHFLVLKISRGFLSIHSKACFLLFPPSQYIICWRLESGKVDEQSPIWKCNMPNIEVLKWIYWKIGVIQILYHQNYSEYCLRLIRVHQVILAWRSCQEFAKFLSWPHVLFTNWTDANHGTVAIQSVGWKADCVAFSSVSASGLYLWIVSFQNMKVIKFLHVFRFFSFDSEHN